MFKGTNFCGLLQQEIFTHKMWAVLLAYSTVSFWKEEHIKYSKQNLWNFQEKASRWNAKCYIVVCSGAKIVAYWIKEHFCVIQKNLHWHSCILSPDIQTLTFLYLMLKYISRLNNILIWGIHDIFNKILSPSHILHSRRFSS